LERLTQSAHYSLTEVNSFNGESQNANENAKSNYQIIKTVITENACLIQANVLLENPNIFPLKVNQNVKEA
jgi:hypothetical protein